MPTGSIDHVHYLSDMADELTKRGDTLSDEFKFRLHLLSVPHGQEFWKMNYLRFFYQSNILHDIMSHTLPNSALEALSNSGSHLLVVPDSALSHSQTTSQIAFKFDDATHEQYRALLGLPYANSTGANTKVAIIDTGLGTHAGIIVSPDSRNYHDSDPKNVNDISDRNGHGTAVASIIHDVAPNAQLRVLKVGDSNPISEWNVIAALIAAKSADIINMSLAYGLPYRDCPECGRQQTTSSRSVVFEQAISEIGRISANTVIVAAAGNRNNGALDYPSKFGEVVAVGAIDSQFNRSNFANKSGSNYGTRTPTEEEHKLVFFAPGGGNGEYVGSSTIGRNLQGTSFAAPYVTGLFALYYGDPEKARNRAAALKHFADRADLEPRMVGYTKGNHGHGVIRI